jgi:hypothetical protein
MPFAPLSAVPVHGRALSRIGTVGAAYVYQPGTTTQATVYGDAAGTVTLTQPITWSPQLGGLRGYVPAGEYDLSCGDSTLPVEVSAGDQALAPIPSDDYLSVYNACPQECIPSVSATTTSQTIKLVRIVPDKKITAAQVVLVSGTASA